MKFRFRRFTAGMLAILFVLTLTVIPKTPVLAQTGIESSQVYTVKKGDTLNKIAASFGTTIQEIGKLNGIKNLDRILIGQQLVIPVDNSDKYDGKTVILHTNDVHGSIDGYAAVAGLRDSFEDMGAEVILVDAGDFSQGKTEVVASKGLNAVKIMNKVGYDVACPGNHEFDFGWKKLSKNMKRAKFNIICSNVYKNDEELFEPSYTYVTESGLKVGFVGVLTPETKTSVNPSLVKNMTFLNGDALYDRVQAIVDDLAKNADVVICLSHFGIDLSIIETTSYDLYKNIHGIDFIIDAHSHTVMTEGNNKEPIQSTGTAIANIGVIIIDDKTKTIEEHYLIPVDDTTPVNKSVAKYIKKIKGSIEKEYGEVFAVTDVDLEGNKEIIRISETNLGDLVTDAMLWKARTCKLDVDADHMIVIENSGGIRATIPTGDITKNDIVSVLPFDNTLTVAYVKGTTLLETLEASTFCAPLPIGGFPQVSGIEFTINSKEEFDALPEEYPGSSYFGPASIKRVEIVSVNGKEFNPDDTYAVITNDFCSVGGDTYYSLYADRINYFDTGLPLKEVLMEYIVDELGGTVGDEYAFPQGRITFK